MKKCVIVINGQGRSGKDTICRIMAKRYKVKNVSAIDPVKNIAGYMGWQGEKTDAARKMLADLKQVMIEYGDIPFKYIMEKVAEFEKSDEQLMFIHVREPEEIKKIVENCPLTVKTLLVRRNDKYYDHKVFGNHADDDVENYNYDFIYSGNNENVEQLENSFNIFFDKNILPLLD